MIVEDRAENTNLVEVDVHALKLKIRRAIVAMKVSASYKQESLQSVSMMIECLHARAVEAMLARDGLPICLSISQSLCRVRVSEIVATLRYTHQKAAPI